MSRIVYDGDPRDTIVKEIHISNWRMIEDHGDHIDVVLANCNKFTVYMTLDEFTEIVNDPGLIVEGSFEFLGVKLACLTCEGTGKVDWIQRTRQSLSTNFDIDKLKFYRKRQDKQNNFEPMGEPRPLASYGAIPIMAEGFEVCGVCHGTGLFVTNYIEE